MLSCNILFLLKFCFILFNPARALCLETPIIFPFFLSIKQASISPSLGKMLSFSGDKLHGGDPIYKGRRYIIAAFLMICPVESVSYLKYIREPQVDTISHITTGDIAGSDEDVSKKALLDLLEDIFDHAHRYKLIKAASKGAISSNKSTESSRGTFRGTFSKSTGADSSMALEASSAGQAPAPKFSFGFF
jgi:hypothetical protein